MMSTQKHDKKLAGGEAGCDIGKKAIRKSKTAVVTDEPRQSEPRGGRPCPPVDYAHGNINKRKFRSKPKRLNLACWNVRTLLDRIGSNRPERRTALVARELQRYNLDVVALAETRFHEEGQLEEVGAGYTFFWKGRDENLPRESGVGFAIKSELVKSLDELPTGVSDRIMHLRFPIDINRFATIISAYAPTLVASDDDIGRFYSDLRAVLRRVPKDDKLILMGDLNARVGSDHETWSALGRHGIGNMNSNGLQLLTVCSEFNLVIGNTWFRGKHKGTWMHPRSKHWHLIDYVIVRRNDLRDLYNVRVMRGAECSTDHRLVRAKFSIRIRRRIRKTNSRLRRIDVTSLNSPDVLSTFQDKINALTPLDVNDRWKDFREKIYSLSSETLGLVQRKHQDWFDDNDQEIRLLLDRKHSLVTKSLSPNLSLVTKDGIISEMKTTKATIQRRLRVMENEWWQTKAAELQHAADTNNTKQLYTLLSAVYGPRSLSIAPIKSKDGMTTYTKSDDIANRWREHFDELLNRPSNIDSNYVGQLEQRPLEYILDVPPELKEVTAAIMTMNSGKAPGLDGIPAEVLKCGGERLYAMVHEIICCVWDDDSPQDWRDAIMIATYKKSKKDVCDNYRGISLLCVCGKVLARILQNRMNTVIAPDVLPESQCGFRAKRGTADMIFSARLIQEKCIEQNMDLYQCFVDLTKAFDTVHRGTLWEVLGKLGCPPKFLGLIRSLHEDMKAQVCFNGTLSQPISVENGVKQGCILGPTLFGFYFAVVLGLAFKDCKHGVYIRYKYDGKKSKLLELSGKRFGSNVNVMSSLLRDLLYADDCDIVTHAEEDMQIIMDCFDRACAAFGLQISVDKTKVMYTPSRENSYHEPNIFVKGQRLAVVDSFVYLGSKLTQSGLLDGEVEARIEKASSAFGRLEDRAWSKRGIKIPTKVGIYRTAVLSTLLYACGTWVVYSRHLKVLERFHQYCLRRILNIHWSTNTPDTEVLQRAGLPSIELMIVKCRTDEPRPYSKTASVW